MRVSASLGPLRLPFNLSRFGPARRALVPNSERGRVGKMVPAARPAARVKSSGRLVLFRHRGAQRPHLPSLGAAPARPKKPRPNAGRGLVGGNPKSVLLQHFQLLAAAGVGEAQHIHAAGQGIGSQLGLLGAAAQRQRLAQHLAAQGIEQLQGSRAIGGGA
jgi:hypothetical protein